MFLPTIYRSMSKRLVLIGFVEWQFFNYSSNRRHAQIISGQFYEISDLDYYNVLINEIQGAVDNRESDRIRIGFDISSMNRIRISIAVRVIFEVNFGIEIDFDFVYNIARFVRPGDKQPRNVSIGPVEPTYSGIGTRPDLDTLLVLGLGYEGVRAQAAIDVIQPTNILCMLGQSPESIYDYWVRKRNDAILDILGAEYIYNYSVSNPYNTFYTLASGIDASRNLENIIIFPFGPKIFSLCSMLAVKYSGWGAVWRITDGGDKVPVNSQRSGVTVGIRCTKAGTGPQVDSLYSESLDDLVLW